jgi:hypothetical protein
MRVDGASDILNREHSKEGLDVNNGAKCLLLLVVAAVMVVLATPPTFGAELRVTGFIDNVFPRWDSNFSGVDQDPTRKEDIFEGRTRMRNFFNFIASDNLRGVFAIEIDQFYGAPSNNPRPGGCVEGEGTFALEQCGFDNGIDNNAIEIKQVYVDFRVPQLPFGNRWRLGGLPFTVTPLHSQVLYTMDAGGGDLRLDFSDQVSMLLYYVQLEEDLDRFTGSAKVGEDYITGATLMLKPISGLDFHILGVYNHGQAPFGDSLTGSGGPFNGVDDDTRNVETESRYYLGFDARYRIGNTSIEPGFLYLLGSRKFSSASAALTGIREIDYNAYQGYIQVEHSMGSWEFGAIFGYASGDSANSDLNNRGIGNQSDVKGFRTLGVDGSHFFGEWFELFGTSQVDGPGDRDFRRMGEVGKLDRFGWMQLGGKIEYKLTDKLVLEGAGGGFWTAKKTACPANFRVGSVDGPCTGPGVSRTGETNEPSLNFTGNSRFLGWEIDAGVRYSIMPGLTWTPRVAYGDYGDAVSINNRKAQDAWAVINRLIYIF